jgi:replicative DNA helicase
MPTPETLPHSPRAEKAVLGCLVLDGIAALEKCTRLREDMFALDSHRRIYRVVSKLLEDGVNADYIAVGNEIRKNGDMERVGGVAYLMELTEGLPRNFNPAHHVETIIEKWKLRQGMRICDRYASQFAAEEPSDATLSLMQSEVFDAMQEMAEREDPLVAAYTVKELDDTLDYTKTAMGMSYGHAGLNSFTLGMQEGEVTVVGARSGVGKSSLMIQAAHENAREGMPVDLYSLEMKRKLVLWRLWALESGLPFNAIKRKLLNDSERRLLREAAYRVAEMPIRIYDDSEMTLGQIAAMARLSARRNGMKFFAVDYAQIVNAEGRDEKTKVSSVSRTLTKLAKSENVHLMLLSQLRKVPSEMYNKAPHIGDLRETGQLENDCHTCVLLHRGWDEDASRIALDGELIIPKQRNGATGALQAKFNPNSLIFE